MDPKSNSILGIKSPRMFAIYIWIIIITIFTVAIGSAVLAAWVTIVDWREATEQRLSVAEQSVSSVAQQLLPLNTRLTGIETKIEGFENRIGNIETQPVEIQVIRPPVQVDQPMAQEACVDILKVEVIDWLEPQDHPIPTDAVLEIVPICQEGHSVYYAEWTNQGMVEHWVAFGRSVEVRFPKIGDYPDYSVDTTQKVGVRYETTEEGEMLVNFYQLHSYGTGDLDLISIAKDMEKEFRNRNLFGFSDDASLGDHGCFDLRDINGVEVKPGPYWGSYIVPQGGYVSVGCFSGYEYEFTVALGEIVFSGGAEPISSLSPWEFCLFTGNYFSGGGVQWQPEKMSAEARESCGWLYAKDDNHIEAILNRSGFFEKHLDLTNGMGFNQTYLKKDPYTQNLPEFTWKSVSALEIPVSYFGYEGEGYAYVSFGVEPDSDGYGNIMATIMYGGDVLSYYKAGYEHVLPVWQWYGKSVVFFDVGAVADGFEFEKTIMFRLIKNDDGTVSIQQAVWANQ